MTVIAVVGTPHSGKSVFIAQLYKYLRSVNANFFVIRACPDGEGQWSAEASPDIVQKVRVKGKFDKEFVDYQVRAINNAKSHFDLVIVDMGGLPTQENREILKHCDGYILLKRPDKVELIRQWEQLLNEINLKPISVLESVLQGTPKVEVKNNILFGLLVNLDRMGVPDPTVECIRKVGEFLLGGVKSMSENVSKKYDVSVKDCSEHIFIDIKVGGNGLITNDELPELVKTVEETVGNKYFGKGVVISGRLPIWAHSAIAHLFHASKFVAHFDPRLKGGVIASAHDVNYKVGQVIPVDL